MNSKDHYTEESFPSSYEVTKHDGYNGLHSAYKGFLSYSKDPLYQFPILDTQGLISEARACISSQLLSFSQGVNISQSLNLLHSSSPFKKTQHFPEIFCFNLSDEAPTNSIATSDDYLAIETNRGEPSPAFLDVPNIQPRSITPTSDMSIPMMSSFDKSAIKNIHRNFIANGRESLYRSITPDHSFVSETPAERLLVTKVIEDNLNFSKISRFSDAGEELMDNWGSTISPRPSIDDRQFFTASVLERLRGNDITEDCFSFIEEGTAQVIRDFIPIESTASKNLLLSSKVRHEFELPNPNSPILRKLVICENEDIFDSSLKIIDSICFVGFKAALSLEYSNIEAANKAKVDYHKDTFTTKSLFSEKILIGISKNAVVYISCGFEHCALLTASGTVMTWGYGSSGCLGHGSTLSLALPTKVADLNGSLINYIECGGYHTLAISANHDVFMWGRGDVHQLGLHYRQLCKDEMGYVALRPIKLNFFSVRNLKPKSGACGESHTLILDSEGKVYAFGWGEYGQLGLPRAALTAQLKTSEITEIRSIPHKIIKVSAGCVFSAALTESGEVYVWGCGNQGQLGLSPSTYSTEEPSKVSSLGQEFIIDIVCGENYMICLSSNGRAFGWGQGKAGVYSSQDKGVSVGTDMICSYPRPLAETDIAHHFVIRKANKNLISSQEYLGIVQAFDIKPQHNVIMNKNN